MKVKYVSKKWFDSKHRKDEVDSKAGPLCFPLPDVLSFWLGWFLVFSWLVRFGGEVGFKAGSVCRGVSLSGGAPSWTTGRRPAQTPT